tara:strand:+ start:545 stop:970 length:426 start_codon:yes stop_codon:yes gene_type:complete
MLDWVKGFISGFIATVLLSIIMIFKSHYGFLPAFNVINDFNIFLGSESLSLAYIIHFIIGTFIWGGLFVFMLPVLFGPFWFKGLLFGLIGWLFMMVGYMPVMEHGLFAKKLGLEVLFATLILHFFYGLILGGCFGILSGKR